MPFKQELETLVRSRYPIIYVLTSEELRLQNLLREIAESREKRLFEWSCSVGIVPAGTSIQTQKGRVPSTKDPIQALDHVIEQVEPAIFLFKDFHPFLSRNHPLVIRKLKEIALQLKNSFKTIVLVSPILEIPQELEKEITVLNFPLPDKIELGLMLDHIAEEVQNFHEVEIELDASGRERLLQAAMGLTLTEAENVFAKVIVQQQRLSVEAVPEIFSEKQQIIRKSGLLEYYNTEDTIHQLGGLDTLKKWLRKRALAFSQEARDFGLPSPKGLLLVGVQGCGKSLCAKVVSSLWQMPLLRFDIGRMFGSYVGSSEENVRKAIAVAESVAPAVLWVDEIDKAFASQSGSSNDGGTTARVFGTFLTWLSEKKSSVFVVATANDISHLPAELMRKGRFDEIFFVDLPNAEEREIILGIHLSKRGRQSSGFDLPCLVNLSEGFSGAEIEEAIVSGLFDAFSEGRDLATDDISRALQETFPLSQTMSENLSRLRVWARGRARLATPHMADYLEKVS